MLIRHLRLRDICSILFISLVHLSLTYWGAAPLAAQDAAAGRALPQVDRIVFLGDSITHAGGYIALLESAAGRQSPDRHIEFLNLGLPSETVSGLSEPGHAGGQFPRPDLHERLARVLAQSKPKLVIACYGMNDGIYYPLGEDRSKAFREGMNRLHQAVVDSGADIIHLTPALFDAQPIKDRVLPAGRDEYRQPYEGYDQVLTAYSEWLLSRRADGWKVLDVHAAMRKALDERRAADAKFTFAGDGVHPNDAGQAVIAGPLAEAWGLDLKAAEADPAQAARLKAVKEKQNVLKLAWLSATGHKRPGIPAGLSIDQAAAKAAELDKTARGK
ncbi:MAG: SGNH/GDSL hydrolase family protein [Pirellulales bacterium]